MAKAPQKKLDLRKTLFLLPNMITLSSIFCGFDSIRISCSAQGEGDDAFYKAALLLVYALFFDMLDGRVARLTKTQSAFGLQIDSLADVVSFGVAPAVVGFALGLRHLLDSFVLVYFVCCGISRLARFNVTAAALSDGTGKVKYYEGTPIPTSLVLVALLGWFHAKGWVGPALPFGRVTIAGLFFHPISLVYAVSGSLMASTLRIPKP